jgi:hypothetical protein
MVFSDYFDVLISKIIFKKYYFDIFLNKNIFKKLLQLHFVCSRQRIRKVKN